MMGYHVSLSLVRVIQSPPVRGSGQDERNCNREAAGAALGGMRGDVRSSGLGLWISWFHRARRTW